MQINHPEGTCIKVLLTLNINDIIIHRGRILNKIDKFFAAARAKHTEVKEFVAPNKRREKNLFDGLLTEYRYDEVIKIL